MVIESTWIDKQINGTEKKILEKVNKFDYIKVKFSSVEKIP